jgi:SAM-dependent methyltransferase
MSRDAVRWERLSKDPYYAVLNDDSNRGASSDARARAAFFESGERDVDVTVGAIRRWIAPDFHPRHAVDFGCGVGRLVIPLSRVCDHVTGVDIAPSMLTEARANCAARAIVNVDFATTEAYLATTDQATVDFVHSFIVFQHLPVATGERILKQLVERLEPGGIGAIHLTYARSASLLRKAVNRARRWIPGVNLIANVAQHRPALEPMIPMYQYDLGRILNLLRDRGCTVAHLLPTDHGGHLGATILFQTGGARAVAG